VTDECDGRVPAEAPEGKLWDRLHARLRRHIDDLRDAYGVDGFDSRRAIALLDEIVASAVDFGHVCAHERERPDDAASYRAALAGQLAAAAALSAWAAPALPHGSARLAALPGLPTGRRVHEEALAGPAPGTVIDTPEQAEEIFGA
jgi:methionyl-tRNA synthetase